MAKLKIGNEWWTSPTESETGALIMVTGRQGIEPVIATGKYNDRIEITWKYTPEKNGMPDFKTSSLMEQVTDALNNAFAKDSAAVMTGIYTGDGERNWVFYTLNPKKFQYMLNDALKDFELLPITLYAEKDPEWNEYREMKDLSEVFSDD